VAIADKDADQDTDQDRDTAALHALGQTTTQVTGIAGDDLAGPTRQRRRGMESPRPAHRAGSPGQLTRPAHPVNPPDRLGPPTFGLGPFTRVGPGTIREQRVHGSPVLTRFVDREITRQEGVFKILGSASWADGS
jgi:hypothetical protein